MQKLKETVILFLNFHYIDEESVAPSCYMTHAKLVNLYLLEFYHHAYASLPSEYDVVHK